MVTKRLAQPAQPKSKLLSFSSIINVNIEVNLYSKSIIILNSDHMFRNMSRQFYELGCKAVAMKGKEKEIGISHFGGAFSESEFYEKLDPFYIGRKAAEEALQLVDASKAPNGEFTVVFSAGCGLLIHEAIGHLLEADIYRKENTFFYEKLGKRICSEQFQLFDDPSIKNLRGTYEYDDEGTKTRVANLIKDGKLIGVLSDKASAKYLRIPLTGHARRQSSSFAPLPRMANTYVANGEYTIEEILKPIKKGIYVRKISNGNVNDNGKYSFVINLGSLIEDGRITKPLKYSHVNGSVANILCGIERIGNDLKFDEYGYCHKKGQSIFLSYGCPSIRIGKMMVGY